MPLVLSEQRGRHIGICRSSPYAMYKEMAKLGVRTGRSLGACTVNDGEYPTDAADPVHRVMKHAYRLKTTRSIFSR